MTKKKRARSFKKLFSFSVYLMNQFKIPVILAGHLKCHWAPKNKKLVDQVATMG